MISRIISDIFVRSLGQIFSAVLPKNVASSYQMASLGSLCFVFRNLGQWEDQRLHNQTAVCSNYHQTRKNWSVHSSLLFNDTVCGIYRSAHRFSKGRALICFATWREECLNEWRLIFSSDQSQSMELVGWHHNEADLDVRSSEER